MPLFGPDLGVILVASGTTYVTDTVVLSGGANVTVGTAGSTITISAGGGGPTRSLYEPYDDREFVAGQVGQGALQFNPDFPGALQFDRILLPMVNTNSSNSSGSHTISFWVGLYTRNVSTLSLSTSVSTSLALTHSGTAGSYSLYSGIRLVSLAITNTLTEGRYWYGILSRTSSAGTNGSYSQLVLSNLASNFLGHWSSSHNTTYQWILGQGVYTATTSALPSSVAFSQIRGSDSLIQRPPILMFASGTV